MQSRSATEELHHELNRLRAHARSLRHSVERLRRSVEHLRRAYPRAPA